MIETGWKSRGVTFAVACLTLLVMAGQAQAELPLPDNDVYLMTPKLHQIVERYMHGELVDFDKELEAEAAAHPKIPSTHLWNGAMKVRRKLINQLYKKHDKQIEQSFNTCVELATRVVNVPKYRLGGMFHIAACRAGLAMLAGANRNYLDAQKHGTAALNTFMALDKERPGLQLMDLVLGLYNFYVGRFGGLISAIMKVVGLPSGDVEKGKMQIERAAKKETVFWFLSNMFYAHMNSPYKIKLPLAEKIAKEMVKREPKNADGYLTLAYIQIKRSKWKEALHSSQYVMRFMPEAEKMTDLIFQFSRQLAEERMQFAAVMANQDEKSFQALLAWTKRTDAPFQDAPILACIFLGHIYSFGGDAEAAKRYYRKAYKDYEYGEWTRDLAAKYEARPIIRRQSISPETKKKIQAFVKAHPMPKK